eukprot:TRINITY_DN18988_c0_g1_i1.p1 TRINITY_DN18988_c0_g1~~TRINITY_DN18988_c0_g1_i1.p1  ORF type:complete len:256 (-),score=89.98 TRINITY_DN18988_c0_g1_i1:43-810(-)
MSEFCGRGGTQHLSNAPVAFPVSSMSSSLARECFWYLVVDLEIIMISGFPLKDYVKDYEKLKEQMIERVLVVMDTHAKYRAVASKDKAEFVNSKEPVFESEELAKVDCSLIKCGFSLIREGKDEYRYFEGIVKFEAFRSLLVNGLIFTQNQQLQLTLIKEIVHLYNISKEDACSDSHPIGFMASFMLQAMVKETLRNEVECRNFYSLARTTLSALAVEDLEKLCVDHRKVLADISGPMYSALIPCLLYTSPSPRD